VGYTHEGGRQTPQRNRISAELSIRPPGPFSAAPSVVAALSAHPVHEPLTCTVRAKDRSSVAESGKHVTQAYLEHWMLPPALMLWAEDAAFAHCVGVCALLPTKETARQRCRTRRQRVGCVRCAVGRRTRCSVGQLWGPRGGKAGGFGGAALGGMTGRYEISDRKCVGRRSAAPVGLLSPPRPPVHLCKRRLLAVIGLLARHVHLSMPFVSSSGRVFHVDGPVAVKRGRAFPCIIVGAAIMLSIAALFRLGFAASAAVAAFSVSTGSAGASSTASP
jgi:hypothetical protein